MTKKQKILGVLCCGLVITLIISLAAFKETQANQNIRIIVDGKDIACDVPPFIKDGRTFVPIRFVAEALGAEVKWDDNQKIVYIKSAETIAQEKAQEAAKKQQEELKKMTRSGEVVTVKPESITLRVESGGGDIGQTITVTANEYTSIQIGMNFVMKPGEKPDLTKYFKPGDKIYALVKNGQAMALQRELRPNEQQP